MRSLGLSITCFPPPVFTHLNGTGKGRIRFENYQEVKMDSLDILLLLVVLTIGLMVFVAGTKYLHKDVKLGIYLKTLISL